MIETIPYANLVAVQVIKLMLYKAKGEPESLSKKNKSIIKKFLLEIDNWDENSLWVIANSLEIYDFEEAKSIMNWLLNNQRNFAQYTDYKIKLLAQICVNYLQLYVKNKQAQEQIAQVYNYMNQLPQRSIIFNEKVYARYLRAAQNGYWDTMHLISQYLKMS